MRSMPLVPSGAVAGERVAPASIGVGGAGGAAAPFRAASALRRVGAGDWGAGGGEGDRGPGAGRLAGMEWVERVDALAAEGGAGGDGGREAESLEYVAEVMGHWRRGPAAAGGRGY